MRNTRLRLWAALAVAVVLAAVAALAGLGGVISIFSTRDRDVSGGIVIACLSIIVIVLCVRWAVRTEHRLRMARPGNTGSTASPGTPGSTARRPPRLYHHRHGPVVTAVGAVFFTLVAAGMIVGAVEGIGAWRLSRYVQAHGAERTATVVSVNEVAHHGRYSTWYTSDVSVMLTAPVGGQTTTTAHYPGPSTLIMGDRVTVLVDPARPGYAEFPGSAYSGAGAWIALLVFVPFMLLVAGAYGYELRVHIRERRHGARAHAQLTTT